MSGHTKGPWAVTNCDKANKKFHQVVGPAIFKNEMKIEDLRLISAAPDLLDVARCLRQHLALFCGPDDAIAKDIFRVADAAISKATGEHQ